ncbi:hypothetical protein GCM10011391_31380 [Pullulanibacillus camelliae]|uniref:Radical SAM core domain-containing protein n=1 Tax=Pullulanibacillus camelliae TaxID=1707096 RepID=A0A8J3DYJ4_9BACL|nr:radical SAM protein [Pullulanibacillus camelliae]GGE50369.1 hypothetical protein GCM10011391_31380 [Pullulanibacillus camelliae]
MKKLITHKKPKTILTPTKGFLEGYSHSLNPYMGCVFGCSYCYVRQMPVAWFREEKWGTWVDVKVEAASLLQKEMQRARQKGKVTVFMSSSTDPYQPLEHKENITRSLLECLTHNQPDFLFVQTRSPLVTRDLDLFLAFEDRIRISMTIETDMDEIRKIFTPGAPHIPARLKALKKLAEAGLPVQATIAPLLPFSKAFPKTLKAIVGRICIDDYFMGDGQHGQRTKRLGIKKYYQRLGLTQWYSPTAYLQAIDVFKTVFADTQIFISQQGFLP